MATGTYSPSQDDIIHRTNVDIVSRSFVPDPIHLVQYDKTLPILEIKIWKNGSEYVVPDSAIVSIRLEKPDEYVVYNPSIGLSSDRKNVYFQITDQMTSAHGTANAVVEVIVAGKVAGTGLFDLVIDRNPVQNDSIESTGEYKTIVDFANQAEQSAISASNSKDAAAISASAAASSASSANTSAVDAAKSATAADNSKKDAADMATRAESFTKGGTGTREGEDTDNAEFYYNQTKSVSEDLSGALKPHGTILFEDLPLTGMSEGWMYNISNEFTSDSRFKDGGGKLYGAGSNVYYTSDGYWDVTASPAVYGVKGANEEKYRSGYVNLTPKDIGLDPDNSIVKHVTKAEYDALPEDKYSNDVVYMIPDMPGSDGIASNVFYDNTESGLMSDSVQEALDELAQKEVSADQISYDNTTSGLTAENVQDAVDEVVKALPSFHKIERNVSYTSSTDLTLVDQFTIPKNSYYVVTSTTSYNNVRPTMLETAATPVGNICRQTALNESAGRIFTEISGYTEEETTITNKASCLTGGIRNPLFITGFYITIQTEEV